MYICIDVNQPVSSQLLTRAAEDAHTAPRNPKKILFLSSFLSSCMKMKHGGTIRPLGSKVDHFLFLRNDWAGKNAGVAAFYARS